MKNYIPYKFPILGVGVNPINITDAINIIQCWITNRDQQYVCVTPAHSVMDGYRNPDLKKIFNGSGLTTPDGMAIVWLLRLQGFHQVRRVYGPDLMQAVCEHSLETGWRHYFYGGAPGVADQLSERLHNNYPGLKVVGTYTPPFRELTEEEDQLIITTINEANPDILWVGIGSPKQELWMSKHMSKVNVPVLIGVGAAFDFLSGKKKQAPLWIQRTGFEWLFRLIQEPKRLWQRYAEYPLFVMLVLLQLLRIKNFEAD